MVMLTWVALLYGAVAQDYANLKDIEGVGCYTSLSSGFTKQTSDPFNSWLNCYTFCHNAGFIVMAMQNKNCWCSNELPAGSTGGSCNIPCYGDTCGGSGAFNVIKKIGSSPSTAASNDGGSASSGTASSGSSSTSGSTETSGTSGSSATSTSTGDSSSSSGDATTTTDPSSTSGPAQSTIVVSGSVITVTASAQPTSSSTSAAASNSQGAAAEKKGLSGGAIAGIVIGSLAGVAALAALLFFVIRRRKEEFYSPNSSPHRFETSFNSGYNQEYPSVVDQRLNPQLLNHRISIASLADARDYSRQILKVANPDEKE